MADRVPPDSGGLRSRPLVKPIGRPLAVLAAAPLLAAAVWAGLPEARAATRSPVETVNRYIDALADGDCATASRLRPGYPEERCRTLTRVAARHVSDVAPLGGDIHVVRLRLSIERGDDVEAFDGFVPLRLAGAGWVIIGDGLSARHDLAAYRRFLEDKGIVATARPDTDRAGTTTPRRPAPLAGQVSALRPPAPLSTRPSRRPVRPLPTRSDAILKGCWPEPSEWAARDGEQLIEKGGPLTFIAPPERPSRPTAIRPVAGRVVGAVRSVRLRGKARLIALTFDICEQNDEHTGYDGGIIDILRASNVPATLYVGGKWMATHPTRAEQLIADPLFEIGNHGWTHGNMRMLDIDEQKDQIEWTQAQYEAVRARIGRRVEAGHCGKTVSQDDVQAIPPRMTSFRFPYGTCDRVSLETVADSGLVPVQWSLVTSDPVRRQSAAAIVSAVLDDARPGAIVVMHANGRGWHTSQALKTIIPALRARGYRFVTVSELLAAGEPVSAAACYEKRPGDNRHYDRIFGKGTGDPG